ncbi:MAG: insulinase family protein [Deltaproteobacteria bacterium]|nr:insulinase family protein [Deltaproteobacteria bacterium]
MLLTLLSLHAFAGGDLAMPYQIHTLDNGLTVILAEDHRTDTVALHVRYDVGAKDERDGEYGCAHLFEHLMFEGSANVPGNSFDTWLTAAGGENNAWTSEDETAYHMTFPSGALDVALFLESDRMGFLREGLTAENLANQQSVVVQERYRYYDAPNGQDYDALTVLLYPPEHPYGHTVLGPVAQVQGFTEDGVHAFWERNYKPGNAVLSLVGNIEPEQALGRLRYWFSDVADRGAGEPILEFPEPPSTQALGVMEDEVEERTLYLSWPTVPTGHPDEPALDLLASILSDGRGTRLDDELYYDRQLATSTSAWASANTLSGYFLVEASVARLKLPKLEKEIHRVLDGLQTAAVTEAELDRARRSLRSSMLDHIETPQGRAGALVACYVTTGEADCLDADWARYQAVTPADISRVAATWLTPERQVSLSVIPNGDKGALPGAQVVVLP